MADLVVTASPAIVRVEGRRRLPASGVIWSADGLIVTANHVVERDDGLKVGLDGGDSQEAELVGRDPASDIALLRVPASDLAAPAWVGADDLNVGNLVLALGRPGRTVQATLGIISALGDAWRSPSGRTIDRYLQTDVAMYPGFSGGPLVVPGGSFAGINTSGLLHGISITVPAQTIGLVVDSLLTHGRVPRGYLGIGLQPVHLDETIQSEVGQDTGLMLMSVETGSPAATAGILQGDILVAIDEQPIHQIENLQNLLGSESIGQTVTAQVIRSNQVRKIALTIGQQP